MVLRLDTSTLRKPIRLDSGFLKADAYLTRTGVLTYQNADGTQRRELRLPEEVFSVASLASLALAPLTLDHPPALLTSETARGASVGAVGTPERAGDKVRADVMVTDSAAVAAIESGAKREISCGYLCDLEAKSGTWNGQQYDVIQRNIRYNHAAIVSKGRAGPEIRLHVDADDAVLIDTPNEETPRMEKLTLDGVDYEAPAQTAQAVRAKLAAAAELAIALNAAKATADKAQARADAADEALKTERARLPIAVKARVALEGAAARVLGDDVKLDTLSDDEVRSAVIKKLVPNADLAGKSPEYLSARFDHALESTPAPSAASVAKVRADGVDAAGKDRKSLTDARAAFIARTESMWKAKGN